MSERIFVLLVLAALAAGCGSDEEAPASRPTTSAPSLAGTYERALTDADIERTDHLRDGPLPGQKKPQPGRLKLALERGTLTLIDVGAEVTIRQDFSATSDGAFRIGAYQARRPGELLRAGRLPDGVLHVEEVRRRAHAEGRAGRMRGPRLDPERPMAAPLNRVAHTDPEASPSPRRLGRQRPPIRGAPCSLAFPSTRTSTST